jgi:hypothetical protein
MKCTVSIMNYKLFCLLLIKQTNLVGWSYFCGFIFTIILGLKEISHHILLLAYRSFYSNIYQIYKFTEPPQHSRVYGTPLHADADPDEQGCLSVSKLIK